MSEDPLSGRGASTPPSPQASRRILLPVLLVVAAVLAVMVLIDRMSLASYETAIEKMTAFLPQEADLGQDFAGSPSRDEVQEALGREPVVELSDQGDYLLEVYRWRRGLPWRTLDLYVVYAKGSVPLLDSWSTTREGLPPITSEQSAD